MTVSSVIPVNNYTGNSSVRKFDFDFLVENTAELVVQHTDKDGKITILKEGKDYSVSEAGNPSGGYIIFPINGSAYNILEPGETISLILDLTIKQEAEFGNSLYFDLHILERTFDYIVRILQIFARKLERCLKVEEGAEVTPDSLFNSIKKSEIAAVTSAESADKSEKNAKYYAELSHRVSAVSQEQLLGSNARLNTGEPITETSGYSYVYNMTCSTFDISKFTVIGNPIVSDNGILSQISEVDYVSVPGSFISGDNWQIKIPLPRNQIGLAGIAAIENEASLEVTYSADFKRIYCNLSSDGINWDILNFAGNSLDFLQENLNPVFVLQYTGNEYIISIEQKGENYPLTSVQSSLKLYNNESPTLLIGTSKDKNLPSDGEFNLKYISVIKNSYPEFYAGITSEDTYTVNESTLIIPYVKSITGSKIVDAIYRSEVQELYEQQGYAPYYTIDEVNRSFTLPQGEIYGMMENVRNDLSVNMTTSDNMQLWRYNDGRQMISGRYEWQEIVTDAAFVQPVLSSNVTPGGSSFAALSSAPFTTQYDTYKAFDNNNSTFFEATSTDPCYIGFYNPEPLKVLALTIVNGLSSRETTSYSIEVSDDGSDWTELQRGTSSVKGAYSSFVIDMSSNEEFHKYYRLRSLGIKSGWTVSSIGITAVYQGSGIEAFNRIVLPVQFVNDNYSFTFCPYAGDASGIYIKENGKNTSYVDLDGTASDGTSVDWFAWGQWK